MPIFSRQQLRRTLGTSHVRDTYVGTTTMSVPAVPFAQVVVDQAVADLALSGQNVHQGSWLRVFGGDLRVASFNVGSGAYVSNQYGAFVGAPTIGMPYERHDALSPTDKDRALDEAVKAVRLRQEVTIAASPSVLAYAVPTGVERVLDAYLIASPSSPLGDVGVVRLDDYDVVTTTTGPQVRIAPAPTANAQLVLDAVVTVSLGAAEEATVSAPDERLILLKAEEVAWGLLARRAPRGTADEYRRLAGEARSQYELLARNFRVPDLRVPPDRPLRIGDRGEVV